MECSETNPIRLDITIDDTHVEQVQQFSYPGRLRRITEDSKVDILCRTAQAKKPFQNKKHLFTTNRVTSQTRKKFLKLYVWCIALYGRETRTISKVELSKLQTFKMWCYRKMFQIKQTERITNETVLIRVKEKQKLWYSVKVRRDEMMGYIGRGRPRMDNMKQIMIDVGKDR